MNLVYAPGCALMIHKPRLAEKVAAHLANEHDAIPTHLTCCHHEPGLPSGTRIINTCAGCDRRYRELYEGISTISLWEVLAESETFPFPDYSGAVMTVHDACPTRTEARVHDAVRRLLDRMNISVLEPSSTRERAVCCGDSFFGVLPDDQVEAQMRKRGAAMPCDDVVVYCVSCIKAMHTGGKRPRYLVDLLFAEDTEVGTVGLREWHAELERFIETH